MRESEHGVPYDTIVLAVANKEFHEVPLTYIHASGKRVSVISYTKYALTPEEVDGRL